MYCISDLRRVLRVRRFSKVSTRQIFYEQQPKSTPEDFWAVWAATAANEEASCTRARGGQPWRRRTRWGSTVGSERAYLARLYMWKQLRNTRPEWLRTGLYMWKQLRNTRSEWLRTGLYMWKQLRNTQQEWFRSGLYMWKKLRNTRP
ncbi:hypothetical protein J6590_051970 [Homalodisca vitripennis]|nr:hypothetical protein J6590_051970 [Homalodisca vitripennis]